MTDASSIAKVVVAALNARDFAALAEAVDEDVAIAGIGGGMDNGCEALRARLANRFRALDETYGAAQVLGGETGGAVAIRLTARGTATGGSYSQEKILLLDMEDGLITRIAFFSADER